jgi:hypothetical protein
MPFQTAVRRYIAPGVKGGWASANPHASLLQSNNGDLSETASPIAVWMVGAAGVIVGNFAFADTVTGEVTSTSPGGVLMTDTTAGTVRVGFVQRDQFALITPYMAGSGVTLFEGQPVTLLAEGDVWAEFAGGAAMGSFVFASYADGSAIAGATPTPPTAAATTVTNTSGQPTLTVTAGPIPAVGSPITGTGVPAGTRVITVAGNVVTMSANSTAGVTSITATTAAPTPYRVASVAANGDIAKITAQGV